MATQTADVVVLGSGPAGYVCAIRLAQLGKKVTIIDRDELGGVCLNRGCIPSKALIYAGSLVEKIKHADEIGIDVGSVKVNLPKLMKWKDSVVKKLTGGVGGLLKANGVTILAGDAKFTGPKALEVKSDKETTTVTFNQIVIATGSRPFSIPGVTIDNKDVLDSTGALHLQSVPKSMLCIGGGYIGLELGTFYAKVGTKVTVVEAGPVLLGTMDQDLVKVVAKSLDKRGVTVKTGTAVKSVKKDGANVKVVVESGGKSETITVDKVLVTIGRVPNSDGIGLEKTGVKLDSKGFILVNAARQTNVPHIYAIGDIAGQPLLAHKGSKEGMVAAEAIGGMKTTYDILAMPAVIFTDPEIATVGLSDAEAKAKGFQTQVGVFPFAANGRALSVTESDGFVKVVGDAKTGRLLGVHIVGVEASNLIAEATLAIEMGAQVEDLALTVHAHPTLPEALMEAAEATHGHAIHIFQRKSPKPNTPEARA
ncbi:MAG: dihydrolipoyl dehydrogenase [Xanthomonadaceae bacterium]|nr:dihydrolipoyl dehydrogenase [Xanthomonadaceae bacterium]